MSVSKFVRLYSLIPLGIVTAPSLLSLVLLNMLRIQQILPYGKTQPKEAPMQLLVNLSEGLTIGLKSSRFCIQNIDLLAAKL